MAIRSIVRAAASVSVAGALAIAESGRAARAGGGGGVVAAHRLAARTTSVQGPGRFWLRQGHHRTDTH
eukprot:5215341-Pyramimonas_sp.AAC.1